MIILERYVNYETAAILDIFFHIWRHESIIGIANVFIRKKAYEAVVYVQVPVLPLSVHVYICTVFM